MRQGRPLRALTTEYNDLIEQADKVAEQAASLKVQTDALEAVIMETLEGQDLDGVRQVGFTWSTSCEPYPVPEDLGAIVEFMRQNGMEAQLELKKSELAARLKSFVKDEALNNELQIVEQTDPDTGETYNVVYSQIPGVRVFLKESLSRTKSTK